MTIETVNHCICLHRLDSEQNIHFHMNMTCVCIHDLTIEKCHISFNDEVFCSSPQEEMECLYANSFLKPIAEKKMERLLDATRSTKQDAKV